MENSDYQKRLMKKFIICYNCGNAINALICPICKDINHIDNLCNSFKEINIKYDNPSIKVAANRLQLELIKAKGEGVKVIKIIHGWGSTGVGGDIKIAVNNHLSKIQSGVIIPGEKFNSSQRQVKNWIKKYPELKNDDTLNRKNKGVTFYAFGKK